MIAKKKCYFCLFTLIFAIVIVYNWMKSHNKELFQDQETCISIVQQLEGSINNLDRQGADILKFVEKTEKEKI